MELQVKIHAGNDLEIVKESLEKMAQDNIDNKLASYLKKFDKEDAECTLELKADKNKKGRYNASLAANLDGEAYHYEREDYEKLDDLVNHLFTHLKESLSSK